MKKRVYTILYLGSLIVLGLIFFTSGMGKLFYNHNYLGIIGPVWLADELAQYGLKLYAQFIGISQVIIGFVLLTYRFRLVGLIMLVPMLMNILMVTISLQWKGTPYVVGFLLSVNIVLLWIERKHYFPLLTEKAFDTMQVSEKSTFVAKSWQGTILWIVGLVMVLSSIYISYTSLGVGWVLSVVGILLSVGSILVDKKWKPELEMKKE